MKCQCCHNNEATMHLNQVEEWTTADVVHFCFECAAFIMPQLFGVPGPLPPAGDVLVQAKAQHHKSTPFPNLEEESEEDTLAILGDESNDLIPKLSCEHCGQTFIDFQKTGRLGCPECYDSFESLLTPALERIHGIGNTMHKGRRPGDARPSRKMAAIRRVADLSSELERAVSAENYERAAELRDEIGRLDGEIEAEAASDA